ncbi:hypothetical protein QTP88_003696 [Uroleucon formosanum]
MSKYYPVKCCVPHCTSTDKSRFDKPKDLFLKWEEPIKTKFKNMWCSFLKNDIVSTWESGIAENKYSICLKRPRLKPGSIPNLLLSTNNYTEISIEDNNSCNIQNESGIEIDEFMDCSNFDSPVESLSTQNEYGIEFSDITTNPINKERTLTFFIIAQYNENYERIVEKQLVLSSVSANVISSIINMFNTVKVCYGSAPVSKYPDVKSSLERQIINSNWKHYKCSIEMCVMCKRLSDSLKKIQKRTFIGKPVRVYFSPSKRCVLEKFKKTKKIATQKVVQAKKTILRLQNYLNDSKQQIKNFSDILRAILLLEDAGLQVLGLPCDGASINKTMCKTFGISGIQSEFDNSFDNPFDESRKVFVFFDAPHIIKNIRNRLVQHRQL